MKTPKAILLPCVFAFVFAVTARAGIVIDDAPQDDAPKPQDTTSTPAAGKPEPVADTLLFANKDVLHGTFLGCDKAGLRWQNPLSKEPILFQLAGLGEVKLDSHQPPAANPAPTYSVSLTNGDELPGVLVSLDDKALLLDTWYAGKLAIPRNMVKSITPWKGGALLYEGPTSIQGWVVSNIQNDEQRDSSSKDKSWSFQDGALVAISEGSIRRDVKLPAMASIEYDLTLAGGGDGESNVAIYCENAAEPTSGYMFDIENGTIQLQRCFQGNPQPMSAQPLQLQEATLRRGNVHIGIRVNKETKTIWLFINGRQLGQWTDKAGFAGSGTSLMFTSGEGDYQKISNIKVTTWDGRLDDPRDTAAKPSKEDSVTMANKDRVTGKLKSIADGKALLASSYADVTIPLERIDGIILSTEAAAPVKKEANDVRGCFAGGSGSVTLQIESWDAKQISVTSPDFGKAVFSPDAFQRLLFDAGQPAAPPGNSAVEMSGTGAAGGDSEDR